MDDIERLKGLVLKLKKNDENVPREDLEGKYQKPYKELKQNIRNLAQQIGTNMLRSDIFIRKGDEEGIKIVDKIVSMLEYTNQTSEPRELGQCLFKYYDVEMFLERAKAIKQEVMTIYEAYNKVGE